MPTKITRDREDTVVVVDHQPGNGTRYVGTAMKVPAEVGMYDADSWVVSFPEYGSAYVVHEGAYLTCDYVSEKWGMTRTGRRLGVTDVSEMAKVIALMVPGVSVRTVTDDHGHLVQ